MFFDLKQLCNLLMLLSNIDPGIPPIPFNGQTEPDIVASMAISTPHNVSLLSNAYPDRSGWESFLVDFRAGADCIAYPWYSLFGQLQGSSDGVVVVGQLGQSLDGRIATVTGHSKYINGQDGLIHLHRLRALVDVVVVGAGTVVADNPKLTVRLVEGAHPARAVIDPSGRVPANSGLYQEDGVDRMVFTSHKNTQSYPSGVSVHHVEKDANGKVPPQTIIQALHARGYRRILVEGGADTVTKFMLAGCLDRIHVILAPMVIGAGRPSFDLPPIESLSDAIRLPMRMHQIGREVLLDCDLTSRRLCSRIDRVRAERG